MEQKKMCPTHPTLPADNCGRCEARIARAELKRDDPPDDDGRAERMYERWLGRS